MKWIGAISALVGTLGLGALALIPGASAIVGASMAFLGPILKGVAEFLVWFVKTIWEGFIDIIDNVATIVTVLTLVFGFSFYYKYYGPERTACEHEIVLMKKQIEELKAKVKRGR